MKIYVHSLLELVVHHPPNLNHQGCPLVGGCWACEICNVFSLLSDPWKQEIDGNPRLLGTSNIRQIIFQQPSREREGTLDPKPSLVPYLSLRGRATPLQFTQITVGELSYSYIFLCHLHQKSVSGFVGFLVAFLPRQRTQQDFSQRP